MAPIVTKALGWLLIAWFAGELPANAVAAPRCDGIEIGVDAPRCLRPGAGQSFKDCSDCPEMVVVPAGSFTMGPPSDEEVATVREDQTRVDIASPFAVGRFAVTRDEFAAFVAATGHKTEGGCYRFNGSESRREGDRSWRSPGFTQTDRHPVVCVNWNDAQAYVAWVSSTTGRSYRLLSETEREYVARAGSTTPFWWGTTISTEQANYDGRIAYAGGAKGEWRQATVPVDSFAANPWGLYNVHGNVWEWTEDCWNENNAGNPQDGTARVAGDCSLRVLRGGAWANAPHTLRSARRGRNPPDSRDGFIGFRVARTLSPR